MKENITEQFINKLKEYGILDAYDKSERLKSDLEKLTEKHIERFIKLNVEPQNIKFSKKLLINENLLNCNDYEYRIELMNKLKEYEGFYHLFDRLCNKNFLESKNYYEDMKIMQKAESVKYALWVISDKTFINSPYHKEDLEKIIEAKDYRNAESLATVASCEASIKSPYHKEDMNLLATCNGECLQSLNSHPYHSISALACSHVSLKDKYHLENMKILEKNSPINILLFNLMKNEHIIKRKTYREEINILSNAKSLTKALAIYLHILNPESIRNISDLENFGFEINRSNQVNIYDRFFTVDGCNDPKYISNLEILNEIDDKVVLYCEQLLSNMFLAKSPYKYKDLETLCLIKDEDMICDLYELMTTKESIESKYHLEDIKLIKEVKEKNKRKQLIELAQDEDNLKSHNHLFDMEYLKNIDLKSLSPSDYKNIRYYLFSYSGINCEKHIEKLEQIRKGEYKEDIYSEYQTIIEKVLEAKEKEKLEEINKPKKLTKIKELFKRRKIDK